MGRNVRFAGCTLNVVALVRSAECHECCGRTGYPRLYESHGSQIHCGKNQVKRCKSPDPTPSCVNGISNVKLPPALKVIYPDSTSKVNIHSFSNPDRLVRIQQVLIFICCRLKDRPTHVSLCLMPHSELSWDRFSRLFFREHAPRKEHCLEAFFVDRSSAGIFSGLCPHLFYRARD